MKSLLLFIAIALTASASARTPYHVSPLHDGATIHGRVRTTARGGDAMPVTKDPKHCGSKPAMPRLVTDKFGGVRYAVVYLESVDRGKNWDNSHPTLAQQHCSYEPHVLVAPLGGAIDIVNNDGVLHNVHGYDGTHGDASIFNIAQPIKGQRSIASLAAMTSPGIIALSCDAGHPWMSGYIFVAPHPYYAVTNEHGEYTIDNVTPGTYTLHMWHEGTHIANKEMQGAQVRKYIYDAPYESTRQVSVGENGNVGVDFELNVR
jgi:plastocyanin